MTLKIITFLLGPAAHSFSTDVEVISWDVALVLEHIVDLLVDVLSLEFANICVPCPTILIAVDIVLVLATLDIIIFIKILLLLLLIG